MKKRTSAELGEGAKHNDLDRVLIEYAVEGFKAVMLLWMRHSKHSDYLGG